MIYHTGRRKTTSDDPENSCFKHRMKQRCLFKQMIISSVGTGSISGVIITFCLFVCFCRALADILRQQGPIPISQYDCENFAAMNGSPKDNTPIRTSSKNHYTPVHTSKSNHGKMFPPAGPI